MRILPGLTVFKNTLTGLKSELHPIKLIMLKFYLIKKTCRGKSLKIIELVFSDFKVIRQYVHAVGDEFYAGSNLVILIVPYLRLVV